MVVLSPRSDVQSGIVVDAAELLGRLGVPERIGSYQRTEVLANVAMVVPAGVLAALALPRSRWQQWTAYAFLAALGVELTQGLLLPARSASSTDVVANTLGMLVGAALGAVLRGVVRRRGTRRG